MKNRSRLLVRGVTALLVAYVAANGALVGIGLSDHVARADIALVLGSKVASDGTLSRRLEARLDEALRLRGQGLFDLIVVSGAVGQEGRDEAAAMKGYLVAKGVPADSILTDSAGMNTFASARNLKAILAARRLQSVLVISQYFHVPRCRLALARFGIAPIYWSHARHFEWRDLYSIPRELVGIVRYAVGSYE
jgi:vancomycin permeability regulator SanA